MRRLISIITAAAAIAAAALSLALRPASLPVSAAPQAALQAAPQAAAHAAPASLPAAAPPAQVPTVREFTLTAEEVDWEIFPGTSVRAWTYNGARIPGATRAAGPFGPPPPRPAGFGPQVVRRCTRAPAPDVL